MKSAIPLALILASLAAAPAGAHELGVGFGETAYGLFYQHRVAGPWQARVAGGVFPMGDADGFRPWSAAAGAVYDLPAGPYLLLMGLWKGERAKGTAALVPGAGVRWGALRAELGVSLFYESRFDVGAVAFGWAVTPAGGLAWRF